MNDQSRRAEPNDPQVAAALREYLERVDQGEPVDREGFLARHAPIADELRSFLTADEDVRRILDGGATDDAAANSTKSFAQGGQESDTEPPASAPAARGDRNLLFGILALQMDFISRDALIAAMHAWVLDKQKPLSQILVEQNALAADAKALLDPLVDKHLELHRGDPQRSLAAVGMPAAVRRDLEQFADPDVNASLARVAKVHLRPLSQQTTLPMEEGVSAEERFQILRSHAWGGLGEVYVARDRELNREVAVKRIHERHAHNDDSRMRFLQEAEITGGLEHPGIVPVYGLGTSADARPFYAMRFIRGQTLKEAIQQFHSVKPRTESERRIELRQLLTRFVAVCNAIEYAHSRGVIHRDLKPSNIMLGKYGETLVVDWGLAKALGHRDPAAPPDEQTLVPSSGSGSSETLPGSAMGTPAYMSPEQSEGRIDDMGPASDVYSLGATLYTILTGKEPFESSIVGVILGKVQTGDFVPPRERSPGVPRALDAVCLKAMSLLPQDRYPSCAALASDIEHWLADEPVTAFKDPPSTRAVRWVRRHRVAAATSVALTAAAFVGLVAGTALLGRANSQIRAAAAEAQKQRDDAKKQRGAAESQRQVADVQRTLAEAAKRTAEAEKKRAEENFRQTRQAVDRYFTLISESRLIDVPGAEPLRKELLNAALDYYRNLPKAESGDAEVQAELAAANFRMALIENLMGSSDWLPEYEKGLDITERLVAMKTPIDKFKSFDAGVADVAGQILRMEPRLLPNATKALERSVNVWEQLLTMRPHSTGIRNDLAAMHNVLAHLKWGAGAIDVALRPKLWSETFASERRARDIWKSLAAEHPSSARFRAALAIQYQNIGASQLGQQKYTESLAAFREARTLHETLIREHPDVPHYRFDLAQGYAWLTILCVDMRNVRGAVEAKRQELAVREKMTADFPTVTAYKTDLNVAYSGALTLVRSVLPQLISFRTNFLLVFDLYTELKEKQNAQRAAENRNTGLEAAAPGTTAAALDVSFPSANSHLDADGLAPLKRLFDKTPKGVRAQLIDTYVDRAKNGKGRGAKTYRSAAAALRWWAGEQAAAVKLLESYAQDTPDDPELALALLRACRSMGKSTGQAGPKPADLLAILFDSLKNPVIGGADAWEIIQSIRRLDPDGQLAAPRWDQLLKHQDPSVRRLALRGLPENASQLKRFAPVIEQCLADADAGVRADAARRSWEINHQTEKILPVLTDCLRDAATENRLAALSALAAIGPDAKAALPKLRPFVADPSGDVRLAAATALWRIGHDAPSADRRAAELVLSLGGSVTIRVNDQEQTIEPGKALPTGAFQLTRLSITDRPDLTDAVVEPLRDATNLVEVNLNRVPITDASLEYLRGLAKLEILKLSATRVTDAGLAQLKGLTKLLELDLSQTRISDAGLAHVSELTELKKLTLWGNPQLSGDGLAHLKILRNLNGLYLWFDRGVTDSGLAQIEGMVSLIDLDLNGTQVTDAGLVHLKGLTNLTYLNLMNMRISGAGLVHLKGLPNLQGLDLAYSTAGDIGMANLEGFTKLVHLRLDHTKISNAGLVNLRGLPNLVDLELRETEVSDAGLIHLKGLTNLRTLRLTNTRVSDAGLADLGRMKRLAELDLSHTQVTPKGVAMLKAALPTCNVTQ